MNKASAESETLSEIKSLMERSSRFISLSGLSGVFAGIFALIGIAAAYMYFEVSFTSSSSEIYSRLYEPGGNTEAKFFTFLFIDALLVLLASLAAGYLLTRRKAKKQGRALWDMTSKRMLVNLFIPLASGGIFCIAMFHHHQIAFIAPVTLVFYGLALVNAGKYTLSDIRQLGILEIIIGLIACFNVGYGLLFWALGFGLMHIAYGTMMYFKYEQEPASEN